MTDDPTTAGPLGEAGARLRALVATWRDEIKDRAGAGCGCYGKSTMQRECANRLETELDALLSAPVVSGWQPIETAPRDGTPILVVDYAGKPTTKVMRHDGKTWRGVWPDHEGVITHWRPLPAAPVVTQEGE